MPSLKKKPTAAAPERHSVHFGMAPMVVGYRCQQQVCRLTTRHWWTLPRLAKSLMQHTESWRVSVSFDTAGRTFPTLTRPIPSSYRQIVHATGEDGVAVVHDHRKVMQW